MEYTSENKKENTS